MAKIQNNLYKIPANTVFIGKQLEYLPTCHSTNDIAAQFIRKGKVRNGMVFITDHQTQGKGQVGNTWVADPFENLTLSIVLKPTHLKPNEQFVLTFIVSLGIHHFLKGLGIHTQVKWPNDIYYGNKKLGGILIQNSLQGKEITDCIVGVGLNINQRGFSVKQATSLTNITERTYVLADLLPALLWHIEQYYINSKSRFFLPLKNEFLKNMIGYETEVQVEVSKEGVIVSGKCEDVDDHGRLIFRSNEKRYVFDLKEVRFLL